MYGEHPEFRPKESFNGVHILQYVSGDLESGTWVEEYQNFGWRNLRTFEESQNLGWRNLRYLDRGGLEQCMENTLGIWLTIFATMHGEHPGPWMHNIALEYIPLPIRIAKK